MTTPSDEAVLGAIAHGHSARLDQSGLNPEWITDPAFRTAVQAAFSLSREGKTVNILSVMARAKNVNLGEWKGIRDIFQNGYGDVDPDLALKSAKSHYLAVQTLPIAQAILRQVQSHPDDIEAWMPTEVGRLVSIVRQSTDYDPRPSAHFAKTIPSIMFKSLLPEINAILRGGYRNGLFFLLATPTKHGKSTMARTLTCDALLQGQRVVYINNENTEQKALAGILRGLSNLTEEEIETKKGSSDERDKVLKDWVDYCDAHLRIYNHEWYNDERIKRALKWEKPNLLIVDYLHEVQGNPGMFSDRKTHADPVGDMADFLLNAVNDYGVTGYAGAQIANESSKKYLRFGSHEPIIIYGTSKGGFAGDIFAGMRRHPIHKNVAEVTVWLDRLKGKLDTNHLLNYNELTGVFHQPPLSFPLP